MFLVPRDRPCQRPPCLRLMAAMRGGGAVETLRGRGEPREGGVGLLMVSESGERVKYGGSALSFMTRLEFCNELCTEVCRKKIEYRRAQGSGKCESTRLALVSTAYLLASFSFVSNSLVYLPPARNIGNTISCFLGVTKICWLFALVELDFEEPTR